MIPILIIIVLIASVSLYDYFSTRNWQQVTSQTRNNTVFENRNREYGAFVIRRDYNKTLVVIMSSLVFGVGGVSAAFVAFKPEAKPLPAEVVKPATEDVEVILDLTEVDKTIEKIDEPVKDEEISAEEIIANPDPIVTNEIVQTVIKTQEELEGVKTGAEGQEKKGTGLTTTLKKEEEEKEKEIENVIHENVTVEALFPGGYEKMARFIQKEMEYPAIGIAGNIQGKCYLRFVVGEDGKIRSVAVLRGIAGCPECDKEAIRVLKEMPKWVPATLNGRSVASYYTMAINFELD